ncbi:hypothetical protein OOU_Y34scaffold00703g10 [Pyricularia oryzae Y34]|uniref:Uncharacterized protein n=2 Tax=Pyricularia oryzae TaxID=318829 RepID=A0AA97NSI5_PYRO3|nr:hypothetical protein OOU_Y34scaffold00703g10 [Pyricularia oryzae Y34]
MSMGSLLTWIPTTGVTKVSWSSVDCVTNRIHSEETPRNSI